MKFKLSKLKDWLSGAGELEIEWNKDNKAINFSDYRLYEKENEIECPSDPDVRKKSNRQYGVFSSNGAQKGNPEHCIYSCTLHLGRFELGYTDFNYNNKYRTK